MDWSRGYRASYRLYRVDPLTWADSERVTGIQSARVESDLSKDLVQSGSVELEMPVGESFERGYYRLVMVTEQDGGHERFDVSTLYYTTTARNVTGGSVVLPLVGRSVLYPASRRKMLVGSYAPMGVDGALYAADLLAESIAAPVEVDGGFRLDEHIVFDVGTSTLAAVRMVLDAGGYHLSIDGSGRVRVRPMPVRAEVESGTMLSLMMPDIDDDLDLSEVPNRYTAIEGDQTVTVTNDDPNSEVSTVSRGYVDDVVDTSPKKVNGETLTHYATRMLVEESTVTRPFSYQREYNDAIVVGDLLPVNVNGEALTIRSTRQALSLTGGGIVVSETGEMEVRLWQG